MQHILEVLKIVEGALASDRAKVAAYVKQLATKLEADDDKRSAAALARVLAGKRGCQLAAARLESSALPVDPESRLDLADDRIYSPDEVRVFLDERTSTRISEFIQQVRSADKLVASGVGIAPTLLMYGPPGCGKTEIGKHIAAQLGVPLLTARSDTLISSYLGSTAKNLRVLFEHAMARPCVLFLDEFDALAKLRDDRRELGELKRVVISLLQNIDAMGSHTVLLAATNHEHLLDRAVWRRFAFTLHVGLPIPSVRSEMLKEYLADKAPDLRHDLLAGATEELSGADIRQLCEDARRNSILRDEPEVRASDFLSKLLRTRRPQVDQLPLAEQIHEARRLNPKLYTVRRLGEIFSVSTGKVSALMKETEGP